LPFFFLAAFFIRIFAFFFSPSRQLYPRLLHATLQSSLRTVLDVPATPISVLWVLLIFLFVSGTFGGVLADVLNFVRRSFPLAPPPLSSNHWSPIFSPLPRFLFFSRLFSCRDWFCPFSSLLPVLTFRNIRRISSPERTATGLRALIPLLVRMVG